jgi:hypothetical protein
MTKLFQAYLFSCGIEVEINALPTLIATKKT